MDNVDATALADLAVRVGLLTPDQVQEGWVEIGKRGGEPEPLLRALQRKGHLAGRPRHARSLRVITPLDSLRRQVVDVPVYGAIPAGFPREQQEEAVGCISMDVKTLDTTRSTSKNGK